MKALRLSVAMAAAVLAVSRMAGAQTSIDSLARDVDRAEAVRAVKVLQRTYAQYAQYALWNEMAGLFADEASLTIGDAAVKGRRAIATFLATRLGGGRQGLPPAGARAAAPGPARAAQPQRFIGAALVAEYAPDVPISILGERQEHFRGGTGVPWEWPQILPMWWGYRNPVTGRTPDLFLSDCVPCDFNPDMSMTRHGYLLPATGPEPGDD